MLKIRLAVAFLGFAMISSALLQAQSQVAPVAPIPSQILTAKKVFISNAGVEFAWNRESAWNGEPTWSGGLTRPYNQLYATIKNWGQYELLAAPVDADIVIEISVIDPVVGGTVLSQNGGSSDTPQFKLVLLDPKTRIVLWTIKEIVPVKTIAWNGEIPTQRGQLEIREMNRQIQESRDKNFDDGIDKLVADLKALIAQPAAGSNPK